MKARCSGHAKREIATFGKKKKNKTKKKLYTLYKNFIFYIKLNKIYIHFYYYYLNFLI